MDTPVRHSQAASQALVFLLADGEYGVDILQVQEIRDRLGHTAIPSAPAYFRGVANLRGEFLPVVDLRVKLGMASAGTGAEGVTIVLTAGSRRVGVVVDAVSEVIEFDAAEVKPMPPIEGAPATGFVSGLVTKGGATIVMLDIEHVLASGEPYCFS